MTTNGTVLRRSEIFGAEASLTDSLPRDFRRLDDGHYRLTLDYLGIEFEIDRLRRKWDELVGELTVRCDLAGARNPVGGVLSVGDLNLSNIKARRERSRDLASRAQARDLDWDGLLEEFIQRILLQERKGQPAVSLRDIPRPTVDDTLTIDGLPLLTRHPVILFGDGGAAKSYLALYGAGRIAQRGRRVALFDWELASDDHRLRLEALFGADMPDVRYVRCDRPLFFEVDRLRRIAREDSLDYAFFDSIAFACDGKPEDADVASRYFRAVRQIGVGSLHIAHMTKGEGGDQKPFGSAFWHNGARATYHVERSAESADGREITVGIFNRKANLGPLQPAVGFRFSFTHDRTEVTRANLADSQDFAARLPLWQRVTHLLRTTGRPMTLVEMAGELDAKVDTVTKAVQRSKAFTKAPQSPDGVTRFVLVERRHA